MVRLEREWFVKDRQHLRKHATFAYQTEKDEDNGQGLRQISERTQRLGERTRFEEHEQR